jgi:hypothetical protein
MTRDGSPRRARAGSTKSARPTHNRKLTKSPPYDARSIFSFCLPTDSEWRALEAELHEQGRGGRRG